MRRGKLWGTWSWVILLMIVVAHVARILSANGKSDANPFFSANDRSRWCTVAALVEDQSYAIDRLIELRDANNRRHWTTIDMVRHPDSQGVQHYYSSKPPLLSVLVAGVYRLTYSLNGLLLTEHPYYVGRLILVIVNGLPFLAFAFWCRHWIGRDCHGLWSRSIALIFALGGTLLVAFTNTLSNHLQGGLAVAASIAAVQAIRARKGPEGSVAWTGLDLFKSFLAGSATALAAACDLPALSWLVALGAWLAVCRGWKGAVAYGVGVAPIAFAFALTNYHAHGEWTPAYAHRGIGEVLATVARSPSQDTTATTEEARPDLQACLETLQKNQLPCKNLTRLEPAGRLPCFELSDDAQQLRYAVVRKAEEWVLCKWDDWYDYPGSYWLQGKPVGVDQGEPSKWLYAFHVLVGHHGIFSLTPMWLIALGGWVWYLRAGSREQRFWWLAISAVTIVCMLFYLNRPEIDRNYGGVSCGFRWSAWMIPLWLGALPPALASMRRTRLRRGVTEVALAISLFSVAFHWSNPWTHPWIYQFWSYLGWIS